MKTACSGEPVVRRNPGRDGSALADAIVRRRNLGTSEFFVSPTHMLQILRQALRESPRPVLSLNRPQVGGRRLVHRLEWRDLVFTCVTRRPLTVV